MLFHPGNELIGVIGFLDSVLSKYRLESLVVAQRVTQAERLGKLTRLVNELVDPLQIVWPVGLGKTGEERTLAKFRSVFLGVVKQPLHSFFLIYAEMYRRGRTTCARVNEFKN
jgi:hypothetical protein